MPREHESVFVRAQVNERRAQQRRARHVESLEAIRRELRGDAGFLRWPLRIRQIQLLPRHRRATHDHLHRRADAVVAEGGAQVGVTIDQTLGSALYRARLNRTLEAEDDLSDVRVRSLLVVEAMKQEALLQRRQRQDLFKIRIRALERLDIVLRERDERYVGRREAAKGRDRCILGHLREDLDPDVGEPLRVRVGEERRRPGPLRRQLRTVRAVACDRDHFDGMA